MDVPEVGTVWNWITTVVTVASIITAATPTPKDDALLRKFYVWIEWLGLVIGKAKDK